MITPCDRTGLPAGSGGRICSLKTQADEELVTQMMLDIDASQISSLVMHPSSMSACEHCGGETNRPKLVRVESGSVMLVCPDCFPGESK